MEQQNFDLVTHVLCPYVQRSIITLKEKSIAYTRTDIDLANKPLWFEQASPTGKVPVLRVNNERSLFESAIICEYLDEVTPGSLHPFNTLDKAYHRAWIEFGSGILSNIAGLYNAKDKGSFQKSHAEIHRKFQLVEREVSGAKFFSDNEFHLIDAAYGPVFRYFDVFDRFSSLKTFANLPKVQAWRDVLQQRESVRQAVTLEYPELMIQFLKSRDSYISQLIPLNKP